jgi:hypothetical protein
MGAVSGTVGGDLGCKGKKHPVGGMIMAFWAFAVGGTNVTESKDFVSVRSISCAGTFSSDGSQRHLARMTRRVPGTKVRSA